MIGVLHGYSLEGSGSNLWTQYMAKAWCRSGRSLHLICQDKTPEKYDFVSEAYLHPVDGSPLPLFARETAYPGKCILHRPEFNHALPVYVASPEADRSRVIPMTEMTSGEIERFLSLYSGAVKKILERFPIEALHTNHAVLMAQVALELHRATGLRFAILPHGSELEYVVQKDARFHSLALKALREASLILFTGPDMKRRLQEVFPEPGLESKMRDLPLGVDTELFRPVAQEQRGKEVKSLIQEIEKWPGQGAKVPDRSALEALEGIEWGRERILLFVGALLPNKGLPLLISALPWLEPRESWRLLVAGHGMMRDFFKTWVHVFCEGEEAVEAFVQTEASPWFLPVKDYFGELKRLGQWKDYLQRARLIFNERRVLFLGFLPHGLLRHLYPCGDLAIVPSLIPEGGPLVYLEALASGCPALGTGMGGMGTWSQDLSKLLGNPWPTLDPRPGKMILDLVSKIPLALKEGEKGRSRFREFIVSRHEGRVIAEKWAEEFDRMAGR